MSRKHPGRAGRRGDVRLLAVCPAIGRSALAHRRAGRLRDKRNVALSVRRACADSRAAGQREQVESLLRRIRLAFEKQRDHVRNEGHLSLDLDIAA